MEELWRQDGSVVGPRERYLGFAEIRELLQAGPVEFVVADPGQQLMWISGVECFNFWRAEVKPHLAEPNMKVRLDEFPSRYFYFASKWQDSKSTIVLLEKHH